MDENEIQTCKQNYCWSEHLVSLPVILVVDNWNISWKIHLLVDNAQPTRLKNYKLSFGPEVNIYVIVPVLLKQKLLTFKTKIK